jgi:hypothetical protein
MVSFKYRSLHRDVAKIIKARLKNAYNCFIASS